MSLIAVFSGISLKTSDLETMPDAELLPPIARGDLGAAFDAGSRVFAIADGVFDQSRAVSPAEILEVLRSGGRVLGSSSMGALRAAELDGHGMIGVGRIYDLVRRTSAFRDDWLGHLFDPFTCELVTLPFIEVVGAVGAAVDWDLARVEATVAPIEDSLDVRFDGITREVTAAFVDVLPVDLRGPVGDRLAAIWHDPSRSLKAEDARALLRRTRDLLRDVSDTNAHLRALEPRAPATPSPAAPGS